MKKYRYETHLHTAECSACGKASAAEQVAFYAEKGFDGIIVTDHFFNGNTTVPREGLSWKEKVERFCEGYLNALREGKKEGLDVFFGWEYSFYGTDFLTYGLSPRWLLDNPQIMEMEHWDYCNFVRDSGGLIIHAHPFREANYIKEIRLLPRNVDGVEVINSSRTKFENKMAFDYAKKYDLIKFAGSDNHRAFAHGNVAGIETPYKIENMQQFVEIIKKGKFKIFTQKS
ncbi:MAG: PHP domain-containing protein [Clostridia bacterium]|nr:PHP domain-containing protein [Clostridia bacterium]